MERLSLSRASSFDFADAFDDAGAHPLRLTRASFGLFARQVAAGPAITWRDAAGRLVMIAGLYPAGDWYEAWWAVGPAMKANLWVALASAREQLEAIWEAVGPVDVRAHIPASSVAGTHVARLFRFRPHGVANIAPWGDLTVWRRVI